MMRVLGKVTFSLRNLVSVSNLEQTVSIVNSERWGYDLLFTFDVLRWGRGLFPIRLADHVSFEAFTASWLRAGCWGFATLNPKP